MNNRRPDARAARLQHHLDGLREGEIRITRCARCGRAQFPPRSFCPDCHGGPLGWEPADGRASIWSFCVFHKAYLPPPAPQPPYIVAVVELVEGPRLVTNIVDAAAHEIHIGDEVTPVFGPDGASEVRFRLAARHKHDGPRIRRPESTADHLDASDGNR